MCLCVHGGGHGPAACCSKAGEDSWACHAPRLVLGRAATNGIKMLSLPKCWGIGSSQHGETRSGGVSDDANRGCWIPSSSSLDVRSLKLPLSFLSSSLSRSSLTPSTGEGIPRESLSSLIRFHTGARLSEISSSTSRRGSTADRRPACTTYNPVESSCPSCLPRVSPSFIYTTATALHPFRSSCRELVSLARQLVSLEGRARDELPVARPSLVWVVVLLS